MTMVHRGQRSPRSTAIRYIFRASFQDLKLAETVSRCNREQVMCHLKDKYESVQVSQIPDVTFGEVLLDSRGRGSFQGVNQQK